MNLVPMHSLTPLLAFTSAMVAPAIAEDMAKQPTQHFRILLENDVLFQEDNDYTNGLRIDYARKLRGSSNYWGVSLTQNMYTPYTNATYVPEGEHPYAGVLSLGAAYMTVGETFGTSTEFQLGVTGEPSYARQMQRIIHGIGSIKQWQGWDNQVPAEVTFQLSSRQDFNLKQLAFTSPSGWESDSMLFARQEVGTVWIRGGFGYVGRFGVNLPTTNRTIGNRSANYGVSSLSKPSYDPSKTSYFFTFSAYGEYVARDLSIEGGVMRYFDSTASRQPWQAEFQLGFTVLHRGVSYYIGATYHTKQFRTQDRSKIDQSLSDFYGAVSIGWSW